MHPTWSLALALALALALGSLAGISTAAGGAENSLRFNRIGSESGPPPSVITSLLQDRAGFVWIGSRDGLTLYDGHNFVTFEHDASDPTSISGNTIRTMYEDRAGNLWLGTNTGGLNLLDRSTWSFRRYRHDSADASSISHDSIYAIVEDSDGSFWVGTQRGLNRFDPTNGTFERFVSDPSQPGTLSTDYIGTLLVDSAGRLWIGTVGGGVNLWDPDSSTFGAFRHDPTDPATLSSDVVIALLEGPAGNLWVGTVDGLNRLNPESGSVRRFAHDPSDPTSLSYPAITALATGSNPGTIWVSTHGGGLNEMDIDRETFRHWRHHPELRTSLSEDKIIAMMQDAAGNLWVGTWGGGVNRLSAIAQSLAGATGNGLLPSDLEDDDITCITVDGQQTLWVGTRTGYLYRAFPDGRSAQAFLVGGSRGQGQILSDLLADRHGRLWVATNGGLTLIEPAGEVVREFAHDPEDPHSIGPGYVRALLEDRSGRLWIGSGEGGLQRLDHQGQVVERFLHDSADPTSLSDNYVTDLIERGDGRLWVGTRSGGLNVFDPAARVFARYLPTEGDERSIGHHFVTSVFEDRSENVWIGTGGGGLSLAIVDEDGTISFERITERDGLIDNNVAGILEDEDGTLWLSTKRGLTRYAPSSGAFAPIQVSDGLPAAEFEMGSLAKGDQLYFGSVRGLMALPKGTPFPQMHTAPVVVRSISSPVGEARTGAPPWETTEVTIDYGEWLAIELAVLDYSPEQRNRYRYALNGEKVDLADHREVTFSGLAPGMHEFLASARNSLGVWTEAVVPLRIRVVPPYWMTGWFRLLAVFSVVAVAFGVHFVRLNRVQKVNKRLRQLHAQREKAREELAIAYQRLRRVSSRLEAAKEDERKHIARELHDEMGPTLTAVIINLQLLAKETDRQVPSKKVADAIELVDGLIQQVRDLSLDLRPPLLDELGLIPALSGYLETQSERAGIKIRIRGRSEAEGLTPEVAILVFRVIQEAVTNVIRHANASEVNVRVQRDGGFLELTVEDDGCGFEVEETLVRTASGKALGLLGMQERVRMVDGQIEIDSTPEGGTLVHVRIPTG